MDSEPIPLSPAEDTKELAADPGWALFFDFDGTLVDIAPQPRMVHLSPSMRYTVLNLFRLLGGAVAVITGRPLADIDRHTGLPDLPIAGSHGLEVRAWRKASPCIDHLRPLVDRACDAVERLAGQREGLLVERKPAGVALHYRARPDLKEELGTAMAVIAAETSGIELMPSKMVWELRPEGATKGTAIRDLMQAPPFAGRRPVFIGDGVSDEDGFEAVQAFGGFGIKIGDGETRARYSVPSATIARALLHRWLEELTPAHQRAFA